MLTGSGKTVAQLTPDASGNATFSNLPDGKYKLEIAVNNKRFKVDSDVDGDGAADLEVIAQRDPVSGKVTFKAAKQMRIFVSENSKKRQLTASEWSAATAKPSALENARSAIALEIKIESSSIKIRAIYSLALDEVKF